MNLEVLAPDGSTVTNGVYGRGCHGVVDPQISRKQFELSHAPHALRLKNLNCRRESSMRILN